MPADAGSASEAAVSLGVWGSTSPITWRKLAEQCSQFLQKGRRVYVEGRLQTRSWDTPEGERRYRTEVVADRVLFLDRMGGAPFPQEQEGAAAPELEPEDIPFE